MKHPLVPDDGHLLLDIFTSRVVGGTLDYYTDVAELPRGPRTVKDLAAWPDAVCQALFTGTVAAHERRRRFDNIIQAGIIVGTDYSGKGGPEMMLRMVADAMQIPHFAHSYYACDISSTCRSVLLSRCDRPLHVFPELRTRLPPEAVQCLRMLAPPPKASPDNARAAYMEIGKHLHSNRLRIFRPDSTSPCLAHPGQQCFVSPLMDKTFIESVQGASRFPPLLANIAGTSCTPWSPQGSRLGLAHEAMEPFYIWHSERSVRLEDVIGHENSPFFPTRIFVEQLSSTHKVVTLICGPDALGYPLRRRRQLSIGLRKSSLVWVGPNSQEEITKQFWGLFCRQVVLDGDAYLCENAVARRNYINQWAKARKLFVNKDTDIDSFDICSLLRGFMLQSHQGYQKMFMAGPRFSNCFIADLSQNPQSHNINSSFMPTQITHSTLYSFSRQCIFTPSELMFAHGWPCIKDVCDQYDSMPFKLDQLSARQQVHLSGNAMHLPMLAMFYLFVLSNCIRRDSMDVFDKWHLVAQESESDSEEQPDGEVTMQSH